MRTSIFILLILLNLSCSKTSPGIVWYDPIVVMDIDKDSEHAAIRVALGISAQVFYLSEKEENFTQLLNELSNSYRNQLPVKVGVENGTNQIKSVSRTDKK
ncbi:hypothetical protein [Flavobacterium sp. WV_118_3]|uniref:hypothetical protein n=1 Tax=Flavobacterium sp. WV_118_3 TaxID=3151764 RepID=UPI003219EA65